MTLPVHRVVVHRDGALVERRGTLHVVDGAAEIRRLPLLLEEGSLRVELASGPEGARLREVALDWDLQGVDRRDQPEVVEALAATSRELAILEAEREALVAQRQALGALAPDPADPGTLPTPDLLASWTRVEDVLEDWARALDERLAELSRAIGDLQITRSIQEDQVQRLSREAVWGRWLPRRVVRLQIAGLGTAEVELALTYRVPGATWTPAYALHADGLFRRARFTLRALVAQCTGEDWTGARIALATTPSTRRIDLPELPALRLGTAQPRVPSPWRPLPADLERLFPDAIVPRTPAPPASPPPAPLSPSPLAAPPPSPPLEPTPYPPHPAVLPPQPAPRPPQPAPRAALAPPAASLAKTGGLLRSMREAIPSMPAASSAPALPEAPGPLEVQPSSLDYARMRLQGFTEPAGERGRLRPLKQGEELLELGLPEDARARLASELARVRSAVERLTLRELPPHHVLPGPVDHAHFRFEAPGTADIPSDGVFHSIRVFEEPIELTVRYRTVPRVDPRVFRRVTATLERSAPLLAGPVEVHVDGALVLTTPWKGTPGRGMLELDLGVEDGLRVARNVRYREESVGIFGGGRRLHTEIEVQVASSLAREARVEVLDRVPVAGDDGPTVEVVESEPVAREYTGDRDDALLKGGRRQVVQVPPGGERRVRLHYAVTVGAWDELVGGDRRG